MELKTLNFSELYFPKKEWSWLRSAHRYEEALPDSFLWATSVAGTLWAWHPKGGTVENGFPALKVRVLCLPSDGSELAAFSLYLKTSFAAQAPKDIEWINALAVLQERFQWDIPTRGLPPFWKETLQNAGLESHLGSLSQRAKYLFLTPQLRTLCYEKNWDPAVFELSPQISHVLLPAFIHALKQNNISANHTKEVLSSLLILVKRFGEKATQDLLTKSYKTSDEFRFTLFRMAQPELAQLTEDRIQKLRALQPPPRTSVFGDPTFEKDGIKITLTVRNMSDWECFKEWVERSELSEKIQALLEIYQ